MAWVQDILDRLFDPNTYCVACISHGKDSIAMLRAIQLLGLPLHGIVTSDVWATQDIPADLPEMWEWKKQADQRVFELYGVPVTHICATEKCSQNGNAEREREQHREVSSATLLSRPLLQRIAERQVYRKNQRFSPHSWWMVQKAQI